jgi:hypothetical protein
MELNDKNKGGRPKKNDAEKRTERAVCRLTKNEKSDLIKLAEKRGLSESELLRKSLFSSSTPQPTVAIHSLLGSIKSFRDTVEDYDNQIPQVLSIKLLKIIKDTEAIITQS